MGLMQNFVTVTIVDNKGQSAVSNTTQVDIEHVKLMLTSEYVTLVGMTIKKEAVDVDGRGNVTFYGTQMNRNGDFLTR
ncbi:hypothetical protein [Lysinibacillus sp. NPDC056232]|uniref:hypothetical protein n=2 Tax=unclassified Lysinibacillus TaxID=2636778 RepID=UPI0035E2E294